MPRRRPLFRNDRARRGVLASRLMGISPHVPEMRNPGRGPGFASLWKGSANRRRVLQAAILPQGVLAALDLERRVLADVAVEDLAVVAHLLDRRFRPAF